MGLDTKTDRLTDRPSQCDSDSEFRCEHNVTLVRVQFSDSVSQSVAKQVVCHIYSNRKSVSLKRLFS
jgi:hypothetical protein